METTQHAPVDQEAVPDAGTAEQRVAHAFAALQNLPPHLEAKVAAGLFRCPADNDEEDRDCELCGAATVPHRTEWSASIELPPGRITVINVPARRCSECQVVTLSETTMIELLSHVTAAARRYGDVRSERFNLAQLRSYLSTYRPRQ